MRAAQAVRLRRLAVGLAVGSAVVAALAGVFAAYLNPHLVVDLANRVWACF